MLNYLKGGPLQDHVLGKFDIFTQPLTDFVLSAQKRGIGTFRLLDREQVTQIVQNNTFTSNGPLINPRIVLKQQKASVDG